MEVVGDAERVIAEHFNHSAVGNRAPGALHDHALKLRLERCEPRDALLHGRELSARNGISCGTGLVGVVREAQKVADRLKREAQLAGVADEGQPLLGAASIKALVSGAALRGR